MKIAIGNKSTLIIKREEGSEYDSIVKIQSSTTPQPYYGINFVDGKAVGGSTLTQGQVDMVIDRAKAAGMKIED